MIALILGQCEKQWSDDQKELHNLKIQEIMQKAKNQSQYTNKLLNQCKTGKGPVSSVVELKDILLQNSDSMEHIVRTELAYYRNIHKSEMVATSNLFKLNSVSHEERLMKLCLLIDGPN